MAEGPAMHDTPPQPTGPTLSPELREQRSGRTPVYRQPGRPKYRSVDWADGFAYPPLSGFALFGYAAQRVFRPPTPLRPFSKGSEGIVSTYAELILLSNKKSATEDSLPVRGTTAARRGPRPPALARCTRRASLAWFLAYAHRTQSRNSRRASGSAIGPCSFRVPPMSRATADSPPERDVRVSVYLGTSLSGIPSAAATPSP